MSNALEKVCYISLPERCLQWQSSVINRLHLTSQAANVVQQRLIEICMRFSHVDFDTISQTFQLRREAQAAA
jgi:hypothetical protein